MDMFSIKVEPEDTFIWDEQSNRGINIPGSDETLLENAGNCVIAKVESVPPCLTDRIQNGFKKEESSHQFEDIGMEDISVQVTVKEDVLDEKTEKHTADTTKNEDLDLGEEGMYDDMEW
ncbi:hypothetical protein HOLleu_15731 [Holothuria leucospilota]|uniref:Uncharacterized protein n=1 Tax=Holothuria leucospilota TaxID=206669 RepID=A0A9Q1HAD4_HOLLE|nr:hypothetical protein HOLleu_15731 [Holothuria leucospilota]